MFQEAGSTEALVEAQTAFAVDLYRRVGDEADNLFFSPFSLSSALLMTVAGARGETAEEMTRILHIEEQGDALHRGMKTLITALRERASDGVRLSIASRLWGQRGYSFERDFLELTRNAYAAELQQVEFGDDEEREKTRKRINSWIETETNHRILDLLAKEDLNRLTRLVLTNAIYFKGDWAEAFDAKDTLEESFVTTNGTSRNIPMMHRTRVLPYGENELLQVLELPYQGEAISMVVFLPKDRAGLSKVEASLSAASLKLWLSLLTPREVAVTLPRLRLETRFSLKQHLTGMGMGRAFACDATTDFSGITGRPDLCLTDVIHQALVEVTEEGTEAAAATGVVMGRIVSLRPSPTPFTADHPFLFVIRDRESKSILFLGRFAQPW